MVRLCISSNFFTDAEECELLWKAVEMLIDYVKKMTLKFAN
jgi:hypothetical protein